MEFNKIGESNGVSWFGVKRDGYLLGEINVIDGKVYFDGTSCESIMDVKDIHELSYMMRKFEKELEFGVKNV